MMLKRKAIQRLGMVSDQKYYLDSHFKVQRTKEINRIDVYSDNCEVEYIQPFNNQVIKNFYPKRYVYKLVNVSVDPISNTVYDSNGDYIAESSSWRPLRKLYSWPQPNIKSPRKALKGTYLFLSNDGYFHWLLQDLPVFIAALERFSELPVIVYADVYSFVKDLISELNNEIIIIDRLTKVENLIMVGKTAGHGNPRLGATLHPQDIKTVRNFYKNKNLKPGEFGSKIYLSRVGYIRSPKNEKYLEEALEKKGYYIFNANNGLSLSEQASLFSSMTHIVGVHGAALANMVWAQKNTTIIELYPSSYIPSCYSILAHSLGFNYIPVCHGEYATDEISESQLKNILQIIEKIEI